MKVVKYCYKHNIRFLRERRRGFQCVSSFETRAFFHTSLTCTWSATSKFEKVCKRINIEVKCLKKKSTLNNYFNGWWDRDGGHPKVEWREKDDVCVEKKGVGGGAC